MTAPGFHCTAYGLRVRSEIAVPFRPAAPDGPPDLDIRIGRVPERLPNPAAVRGRFWQTAPGVFLLGVEGIARYLARDGREIVVQPAGGTESDVGAFLPGSVLAACLQQRGMLTLHASAVATEAGAILFAGHSGSGKSTLLAALVDRGYRMIADDITGVVPAIAGPPVALPAFPALRLWDDAVDALRWRDRSLGRVHEGMEKYVAAVDDFRHEPAAVRTVLTLDTRRGDAIRIAALPRSQAFGRLLRHTYGWRFLAGMGRQREHFDAVSRLARQVPLFGVTRPGGLLPAAALADEVERHLRG